MFLLLYLVTFTNSTKFAPVHGASVHASASVSHAYVGYPAVNQHAYLRVMPLVPVYVTAGVPTQPPVETDDKKQKNKKRKNSQSKENKFSKYIENADKLRYEEYRGGRWYSRPANWMFIFVFFFGGGAIAYLMFQSNQQPVIAESSSGQSSV